jgi:hypothetical protein
MESVPLNDPQKYFPLVLDKDHYERVAELLTAKVQLLKAQSSLDKEEKIAKLKRHSAVMDESISEQQVLKDLVPLALAELQAGRPVDPDVFRRLACLAEHAAFGYYQAVDLEDDADVGACHYLAGECRSAGFYAQQLAAIARDKTLNDQGRDAQQLAKTAYELLEYVREFASVLGRELARPEWPSDMLDIHENLELWNVQLRSLHEKYSNDSHNELIEEYLSPYDHHELSVPGV